MRQLIAPDARFQEQREVRELVSLGREPRHIRAGQHSIRVNDQWRICFRWKDGNAYDVEIADYH